MALTAGAVVASGPFGHANTRSVRVQFTGDASYAAGGYLVQTLLRAITTLEGATILSLSGWATNGTTYYPIYWNSSTGKALVIDQATGQDLTATTNLSGYTLFFDVAYE